MKGKLRWAAGVLAALAAAQAGAAITFYEGEGFRGRAFTTSSSIGDFTHIGFNNLASSAVVDVGRWEVCEDARFGGHCVVLRQGSYASLSGMGVNNRISSVRQVDSRRRYDNEAPEPMVAPDYAYRRRANERVYEVPVQSVHAVVGKQEQRCWTERQQVEEQGRSGPNAAGAVVGAIIGGVLGHQVNGHAKGVATVGGAVAGAAIGANVGRNGRGDDNDYSRDVRHCESVPAGPPEYWDVTYSYRGVGHRAQMSAPPGRTILVNRDGEPRQ